MNESYLIETSENQQSENDSHQSHHYSPGSSPSSLSFSPPPLSSSSSVSASSSSSSPVPTSSPSSLSSIRSFKSIIDQDRLISCDHITRFKDDNEGIKIYRTVHKIFISSNSQNCKDVKVSLWKCYHRSCNDWLPSRLHICLYCKTSGCFTRKHIHEHFRLVGHELAFDADYGHVYCFNCDDYIFDEHFESLAKVLNQSAVVKHQKNLAWWPSNFDENLLYSFTTRQVTVHSGFKGLRGLINLGNTCFMNCIVQTLVHTPPLRDFFLGDGHICQREISKCLVCEMSNLVQEFYSNKNTPHIPDKLLHLVWTNARHLAGYEQQDAHEFFISTLDLLHRHSSDQENISHNNKCNCIIDKIFTGSLQSDLVCQYCGEISSVEDPIWDFSLDLVNTAHMSDSLSKGKDPLSLHDCLELFTRTEHLGKIKCNKCKSYQEFTKRLSMKTLPIVVSFHLKRFEQSNGLNKKIYTFVSFPTSIDMTPFTTSQIGHQACLNLRPADEQSRYRDNRYSLFAVVNHSGHLDNGHYTVFIRSNNNWFNCDDHFVMNATEKEVLNSEGYLLFYQKNPYNFLMT
ncbi:Ubiquitin carboxyl-terminal hydrolase 22 [Sarcoptes scabiei]|nr:Ubiquitin carboxyl-terminal hydrolase 22 [Sarcoptes scabiei]